MTYGLMPAKDYETIDRVLEMVLNDFPQGIINTLEIGVHAGNTSRGVHGFISEKGRINFHTGIDSQKDFAMVAPFDGCNFLVGDSLMVADQVRDNSQHFVFIDGCHNFQYTAADFLMYKDKVIKNGYLAFHDTGMQIKKFQDFQGGDKNNPYHYIACRDAVSKLGLLEDKFPGFKLVIDEWDAEYPTGGIVVVKRIST